MRRTVFLRCAGASLLFPADRLLEDSATATLRFRKIGVPPDSFNQAYATQRTRDFLTENVDSKMVRLTIVPDEAPAIYSLAACDHCPVYRDWRRQWDEIGPIGFPVAELMSIEGNAILRYRGRNRNVSVEVL